MHDTSELQQQLPHSSAGAWQAPRSPRQSLLLLRLLLLFLCAHLALQDVNVAAEEVEEDDEPGSDGDLADDELADEQTGGSAAAGGGSGAAAGLSGPAVQLLISGCWTSWKETALLIGTLARRLPLPTSGDDSSGGSSSSANKPGEQQQGGGRQPEILQVQQLARMGGLMLELLQSMKHNGAVEKSVPGFMALAERLLQSAEPALNGLPAAWLQACLARVSQPGQCRDDIVRRSAGACSMTAAAVRVLAQACWLCCVPCAVLCCTAR